MNEHTHSNLWYSSCAEPHAFTALNAALHADVLVVGGGFTGCSAALELAQRGASVCVLEARSIGYGGSGRNVGLVNAGLWLPPDSIVNVLGSDAAKRLIDALALGPQTVFDIIEREGIACEATRRGTLHLANTSFGRADLEQRFEQGRRYGAPFELLSADECAARVGTERYDRAIFDPRAGTVQPLGYCRGLARAAAAAGAQVFCDSPVHALTHSGGHWIAQTPAGEVRAEALLLATNAYSQTTGLGVEPQYVTVHYHQAATAPLTGPMASRILPGGEGCWDAAKVMSSLRVDQAGRLIVGSMGNLDGHYAGSHRLWLRRMLADLFPELGELTFEHEWCGRIAMTSDHVPRLLQVGPRALAAYGYSGRGIAPGTVFGRGAARWLLDGDDAHLPIAPVEAHSEQLKALRAQFFEGGAALVHAALPPGARRLTSF